MPRWIKYSNAEYDQQWLARTLALGVRDENGCLLWKGNKSRNGYPQAGYQGKTKRVHRKVYEIVNGVTLTPDIDVCHRCDVRNCFEPTHLWAGTRKENMQDCSAKGRADGQWKTHCHRGHPLSGDNLYINATSQLRACKACQRGRLRRRAGWPEDLAYSMDPVPHGHRPVNAKFPRGSKAA